MRLFEMPESANPEKIAQLFEREAIKQRKLGLFNSAQWHDEVANYCRKGIIPSATACMFNGFTRDN